MSPTPFRSLTSFSFLLATVGPSLLLFTSMSSNRPLKLSSLRPPWAEASMLRNTFSRVSLRFSSDAAFFRTFWNSPLGRMKKPLVWTISARASSASRSVSVA